MDAPASFPAKALGVWLGAAGAGSCLGTGMLEIVLHAYGSTNMDDLVLVAMVVSLLGTLPGSALLFLIFAALKRSGRRSVWAALATIAAGVVVGGIGLSALAGSEPHLAVVGTIYASATGIAWAALSWLAGGFKTASQ